MTHATSGGVRHQLAIAVKHTSEGVTAHASNFVYCLVVLGQLTVVI